MWLYILIGIGLAALVGILLSRRKAREDAQLARAEVVTGANVTNDITAVGRGGVFRLPPFGKNTAPVETYVKQRHRYSDAEGDEWFELVCVQGNRKLLVEWCRARGGPQVTGGYEDENPSLEDLGLTEDDLVRFDEDEAGRFEWDGSTWALHTSGERYFTEDGRGQPEAYYGWEFREDRGGRVISVEKWEDEAAFEVFHLWSVDPSAIEVYDAGEESS